MQKKFLLPLIFSFLLITTKSHAENGKDFAVNCNVKGQNGRVAYKLRKVGNGTELAVCADGKCERQGKVDFRKSEQNIAGAGKKADVLEVDCVNCSREARFSKGFLAFPAGTLKAKPGAMKGFFNDGNTDMQANCTFPSWKNHKNRVGSKQAMIENALSAKRKSHDDDDDDDDNNGDDGDDGDDDDNDNDHGKKHDDGDDDNENGNEESSNAMVAKNSSDSSSEYVVCIESGSVKVRDQSLKEVLFNAHKGDELTIKDDKKKNKTIDGTKYTFVQVKFSGSGKTGWVADKYVKTSIECGGGSSNDAPSKTTPTAEPTQPEGTTDQVDEPTPPPPPKKKANKPAPAPVKNEPQPSADTGKALPKASWEQIKAFLNGYDPKFLGTAKEISVTSSPNFLKQERHQKLDKAQRMAGTIKCSRCHD